MTFKTKESEKERWWEERIWALNDIYSAPLHSRIAYALVGHEADLRQYTLQKINPVELINLISEIEDKAELSGRRKGLEEAKACITHQNHVKEKRNEEHDKDEFWGCCECYEDKNFNKCADLAIEAINSLITSPEEK